MVNKLYFVISFFIFFCSILTPITAQNNSTTYQVSGTVVSEDEGDLLVGVGILVEGTNQRYVTDIDGKFSIPISKSPQIINFSYVGMQQKSVTVTSQTKSVTVRMRASTQLKEVVIEAGYGLAQKRSDMVGSAFQVQAKDLQALSPARIDKMLDGLIPGLTIEANTDAPGSPRTRYNIRVRGEASLSASNEPLWIIDGVPVYQGTSTNMMPGTSYTVSPLSYINPDDIESITVLKDASSTSIYGANGANGVIIVKTKSGNTSSGTSISASVRYGVSNIDKSTQYKMMSAAQYLVYAKEAWVNGGNDINAFPYRDNDLNSYSTTDIDWSNLYFGQGQTLDASVSLRNSSEKNSNYLSLSYFNESGTVKSNQQQRFTGRFNSNYNLNKKLTFRGNLYFSYNENDIFALGGEYYEVLPIFTPYYSDGFSNRLYNKVVESVDYDANNNPIHNWTEKKFFENKIPVREDNTNIQRTYQTNASGIIKYEILKGLEITEQFGVNIQTTNEEQYDARTTLYGLVNDEPKGHSYRASATYVNWNNILRLNFNRKFGDFNLGLLAGMEHKHNKYTTLNASGDGFLNDHIQEVGYSETESRTGYSSRDTKRSLSYLGQGELSYKSRYFLAVNARADGNSIFGKYARWAKFGSVGLSWNINSESFFDFDAVDLLKIKTSIGTNGNSRVDGTIDLGNYSYSNTYSYNGILGATIASIPNPGLTWESTTMFNIGVRAELWDRLSMEVEYYNNNTKDLLTKIYTSRTISDDRLYANVGEIRNSGLEITINSKNIVKDIFLFDKNHLFVWETDLIFSHNSNLITKLYNGVMTSFGTTVWRENYSRGAFNLVRWAGVDPSTGAPMWYDKNGDLTYTYSTDDRVMLKDKSPESWGAGSLTNSFILANFSFRFMLNYTFGGYTLSTQASNGLRDGYNSISSNAGIEAENHWSKPGDLATNPRISTVSSKSSMNSTRYLYSKTNIRLQNLILSYELPKRLTQKMHIKNGSISLIGYDLYLWTPDQQKGKNSYKTLMNAYPVERSFSIGLNLGL